MSRHAMLEGTAADVDEEVQQVAQQWIRELVVLSFRENRRGGDPIAHAADGRAVFPDKFQGGDEIKSGEHWVCSVSQKGESTFFATPLARLDARFFADLSAEERTRLAQVVADEFRDELEPELEAALPEDKQERGDERQLIGERDELRERLAELNEQYDDAIARLREMEADLAQAQPGPHTNGQSETGEHRQNGSSKQAAGAGRDARAERLLVQRVESDVLYCEGFSDSNYHGHVSPNRRTLFFKSYGRGTLSCRDGRLEVPGLDSILPGDVTQLEARFDPRHGGFFIKLP